MPLKLASQARFVDIMTYDIVDSLPLELLIYLAKFLDLEDIIRSQRVCTILSATPMMFENSAPYPDRV